MPLNCLPYPRGHTPQSLGLLLDIVIVGTKELAFMARIIRPEISTRAGPCTSCGKKTRSHELEPAEYEEYMQEVVVRSSDQYQSREGWEDVEEQLRSELVVDALVMCHDCWSEKQATFRAKIQKRFPKWIEEPIQNAALIRKSMETLKYYDFHDSQTIDKLSKLVRSLKEAATK